MEGGSECRSEDITEGVCIFDVNLDKEWLLPSQQRAGQPESRVRQAAHHAEDGTGEGVRQVYMGQEQNLQCSQPGPGQVEVEGTAVGAQFTASLTRRLLTRRRRTRREREGGSQPSRRLFS